MQLYNLFRNGNIIYTHGSLTNGPTKGGFSNGQRKAIHTSHVEDSEIFEVVLGKLHVKKKINKAHLLEDLTA